MVKVHVIVHYDMDLVIVDLLPGLICIIDGILKYIQPKLTQKKFSYLHVSDFCHDSEKCTVHVLLEIYSYLSDCSSNKIFFNCV